MASKYNGINKYYYINIPKNSNFVKCLLLLLFLKYHQKKGWETEYFSYRMWLI